jgi:hypothetical protein
MQINISIVLAPLDSHPISATAKKEFFFQLANEDRVIEKMAHSSKMLGKEITDF